MGLPSGISKRGKKFQARLCYVPTGGTKKELRGVGTLVTVEEALAALAEAQRKLAKGGAARRCGRPRRRLVQLVGRCVRMLRTMPL